MAKTTQRVFYRWTRDLHLYIGLFASPFVLAFAISVLFLNHAKVDTTAVDSVTTVHDIRIPPTLELAKGRQAVDLARQIVDQAGVTGEIGFVRYLRNDRRFVIPIRNPASRRL